MTTLDREAPNQAEVLAQIQDLQVRLALDQAEISRLRAAAQVASEKIGHLEIALASARRVGAAIGILMDRHGITDEQAFDALRVVSQHTNRKLRDVADDVVLTGELPELPER